MVNVKLRKTSSITVRCWVLLILSLKLIAPIQLNPSQMKNKRRKRHIWRMVSLIGVVVTSSS